MTASVVAGLLAWSVAVGLDLVSVGQVMIARPLVAGAVAGWLLGDPVAGITVGVCLELFAMEVLPFGAARYPEYGLGAIAGVATAQGAPSILGTGLAVGVGLSVAWLGELSIHGLRRLNSRDVVIHAAQLDAGEVNVIKGVHVRGLLRDAARALAVAGFGLLLAEAVRRWAPVSIRSAVVLSAVAVGMGVAAAITSGLRLSSGGRRLGLFVSGLAVGAVWVFVR